MFIREEVVLFMTRPKSLIDFCVVDTFEVSAAPLFTLLNGLAFFGCASAAHDSSSADSSGTGNRCFLGLGDGLNKDAGEGTSFTGGLARFDLVGVVWPCLTPALRGAGDAGAAGLDERIIGSLAELGLG
jgi:hypothetical protein